MDAVSSSAHRIAPYAAFAARRLVRLAATLLVATFAITAALRVAPGGPISYLTKGRTVDPQTIAQLKAEFHLDDSVFEQYLRWLSGAVHGDLGNSLLSRVPVNDLIAQRAGVTFALVAYTALIVLVTAIPLGVVAGVRPGWISGTISALTSVALAAPAFVVALVLISFFAVQLGWFPTLGAGDGFSERITHLTLPAIALALPSLAFVSQVTRASVSLEMGSDHVNTARVRGIPERTIIRRHVVRNAMVPITTVAGLSVAGLIAGVVVIERAFSLPGLGSLLIESVTARDYATVTGVAVVLVAAFVVLNAIVDLLCAFLDPRLRIGIGGR
jgi:peptide/nickel transport system permease protein